MRARLASLSPLPTHYTRRRTHRGRTWREQTAWTRSYDLSCSLSPSICLSFSLSLSPSLSSMSFPLDIPLCRVSRSPSLSFFSLSLSISFSLSRTRISLAFLPADAGKLSRRCQARFHPPAHKGEPKRAGQSNGVIPPVGMAGVYRRRVTGNVAFSSSVLSPFVENSREPHARGSPYSPTGKI